MKRKMKSKTGHKATLVCLYALCACLAAYAKDKSVEIDGVVYSYWINGYDINSQAFLGHQHSECAVEIPDDRTRLAIPKVINGQTIEGIDREACRHLVDVEEIVLPDSITEIGYDAFRECWSLKKINIPSSVRKIGGHAFEDCESLKTITLPAHVCIDKGGGLFKNCKSLEQFEFPNDVCADEGCQVSIARENNIRKQKASDMRKQNRSARSSGRRGSVTVRNDAPTEHSPYEGLGSEFFAGCSSLKRIALPSSFNHIGNNAFDGCSSLTKVDMPPSIKEIRHKAFRGCKSLETIDLPESVVEIGSQAFKECERLKTIQLPYRITKIEYETFIDCKNLREISIPENVKEIGAHAFWNCTSLQKVTFSPDIQQIRIFCDAPFSGCTSLKEIALPRSIADSVLNTRIDYKSDSKKLRELPGLKITYLD